MNSIIVEENLIIVELSRIFDELNHKEKVKKKEVGLNDSSFYTVKPGANPYSFDHSGPIPTL